MSTRRQWTKIVSSLTIAGLLLSIGGCMGTLRDEQAKLLQPGALDVPIPGPRATVVKPSVVRYAGREAGYYDQYNVPFLDRYFIQYLWYGARGCGHGGLRVDAQPVAVGVDAAVRRITGRVYEFAGGVWQGPVESTGRPFEITRYFRSIKGREYLYARTPSGATESGKVIGIREHEDGLRTMCLENWVGQSQSMGLLFHERSVSQWLAQLDSQWKAIGGMAGMERIGSNVWTTYKIPLRPKSPTGSIWPYMFYVLPVGDSGYSLMFTLWAAQESLSDPSSFAALKALFHRILASVRVESWDERTQAEYGALANQALALQKQECLARAQRSPGDKPFAWCVPYLQ